MSGYFGIYVEYARISLLALCPTGDFPLNATRALNPSLLIRKK